MIKKHEQANHIFKFPLISFQKKCDENAREKLCCISIIIWYTNYTTREVL